MSSFLNNHRFNLAAEFEGLGFSLPLVPPSAAENTFEFIETIALYN
jgi:hypothetical protein